MANPEELRKEMEALWEESRQLRDRLGKVETGLRDLARRLVVEQIAPGSPDAGPAKAPSPVPPPLPRPAVTVPPPLPPVLAEKVTPPVVSPSAPSGMPAPAVDGPMHLPPPLPRPAPPAPAPQPGPVLQPPQDPPAAVAPQLPAAPQDSFEMRAFMYWAVRLGVGCLLLAVIYGAVHLYQTITPRLGPAGKMGLLYAASFGIVGAGAWLRRRDTIGGRMQNFAAVVEGGGFGAVYFTTLAGHVFAPLRIFDSAALVLGLLFAWGALILFLAERRDSPTLATVALLGAGLSASLMPGSWIALGGTAAFAALAAGQWWRRGWVGPTVAALVASYGGYAYWRHQVSSFVVPEAPFLNEALLLTLYLAIFTAGVFAPQPGRSVLRTAFLTANNVAGYCLLARLIAEAHPLWFWRYNLFAGILLLALAALAHQRLGRAEANAFRVQGLILGTFAIVSYFSGWQLGLMLCLEGLALAAAASWRDSRLLLVAGLLASGLGLLAQFATPALTTQAALVGGAASVAFLLGAAWICLHRPLAESREHPVWFAAGADAWAVLAAGLGARLLVREIDVHDLPLSLAVWGLLLTAAHRLIAARALPALGFLTHGAGVGIWAAQEFHQWIAGLGPRLHLTALGLVAISFALDLERRLRRVAWYLPTAPLAMAASVVCLRHFLDWNAFALASAALAAAWVAYGWKARDRYFALGGLLLGAVGCAIALGRQLESVGPGIWPILALALTPLALRELAHRLPGAAEEYLSCFRYVGAQTALQVFLWALVAVPDPWKPLAFAGIALAAALLGLRWPASPAFGSCAAATALTLLFTLAGFARPLHWSQAAALALAFAATEVARAGGKLTEIVGNLLNLLRGGLLAFGFLWVTMRLRSEENAALFTAVAWTLYALLLMVVGLWRRDRLVRLAALGIFGLTIARVLVYETWRLGPLYKVASFVTLGAVLIGLGYVYTKYQDKLRKWL